MYKTVMWAVRLTAAAVVLIVGPSLASPNPVYGFYTCAPGDGYCITPHAVHENKRCIGEGCVTCLEQPEHICGGEGGEVDGYWDAPT